MWGWFIGTRIGRWASLAGAVMLAVMSAWFLGRAAKGREAEGERLKEYVDTRSKMDRADISRGNPDDDLDWLKNRSQR